MRTAHATVAAAVATAAVALVGASPAAAAKEPPAGREVAGLLAQAKAAGDDPSKAGALYGKAVAAAHKGDDVLSEGLAADALEAWHDRALEGDASPTPREETRAGRQKSREALAAVLSALDPKRHGAFVSAHALATELLCDAVALGDAAHVDAAAAAVSAWAATGRVGQAGPALSKLAAGVQAARRGDAVGAEAGLAAALDAFAAHGWFVLAASAGTELAAVRVRAGSADAAGEALAKVAAVVAPTSDKVAVQEWMRVVATRLPAASEAVTKEFRRVTKEFEQAASEGTAGGAGADALDAGETRSRLGNFLEKLPNISFASAVRRKAGLTVKGGFDKDPIGVHALRRGQQHWTEGGLVVAIAGWGVALRGMETARNADEPNERLRASRVRAFWWLAEGESWSVAASGVVSVTPLRK